MEVRIMVEDLGDGEEVWKREEVRSTALVPGMLEFSIWSFSILGSS